jgi:hypothetical protein
MAMATGIENAPCAGGCLRSRRLDRRHPAHGRGARLRPALTDRHSPRAARPQLPPGPPPGQPLRDRRAALRGIRAGAAALLLAERAGAPRDGADRGDRALAPPPRGRGGRRRDDLGGDGEGPADLAAFGSAAPARRQVPAAERRRGRCPTWRRGRGGLGARSKTTETLHSCPDPTPVVNGWARGRIKHWAPVPLDGDSGKLLEGGDAELIGDCLSRLHGCFGGVRVVAPRPSNLRTCED